MTPPTQFEKMRANRERAANAPVRAEQAKTLTLKEDFEQCELNHQLARSGKWPLFSEASNYTKCLFTFLDKLAKQ